MGFLSDEDRAKLTPSELLANETPIPTQVVSSDEYYPYPQTEKQREFAGAAACARGRSRQKARSVAPPLFSDGGGNGGVLRGHERDLRTFLRRDNGGSGDTGHGG
jgi:hypothetical protein